MFSNSVKFALVLCMVLLLSTGVVSAQQIQTPAEKVGYSQGGTLYGPLMDYVYELESMTELMNVQKITETLMGRDVVLCILSNPPIFKPDDIAKTGKPVILIVNNVHGGEVAGKDASMEIMRDLIFGDLRPLLDNVIVLNVPTINPDGAEVRRRTNEQGFDMNRDYLKLETQEIQALVTKVFNKWRPDIQVDTHHGGSVPYALVYQTNMNPAGDQELVEYANSILTDHVRRELREEDYDGFWYTGPGTVDGVQGWRPTSVEPRKQHVYTTLANMIGFLFETPRNTHRVINNGTEVVPIPQEERYKHQVRGQYIGQRALIRYAASHAEEIKKLLGDVRNRAIERGNNDSDNDQIPLTYKQVAKYNDDFWVRVGGRGGRGGGGRGGRGGGQQPNTQPQEPQFELVNRPIFTKFEPTKTTTRPWGYILPPQFATVLPLLLEHDISIKRLSEPTEIEVEVYYATSVTTTQFFQGHFLKGATVDKYTETKTFPAGSFFIPSGQAKSNLISYLLEPETNDNLMTWNFLDNSITLMTPEQFEQRRAGRGGRGGRGGGFGGRGRGGNQEYKGQEIRMYRLMKKTNLKGTLITSFNEYERNRYIRYIK